MNDNKNETDAKSAYGYAVEYAALATVPVYYKSIFFAANQLPPSEEETAEEFLKYMSDQGVKIVKLISVKRDEASDIADITEMPEGFEDLEAAHSEVAVNKETLQ